MALQLIEAQERCRTIALTSGTGAVRRTRHGAFIVYSRIPPTSLLEIIKEAEPTVDRLEQLKTIFLLGPTPRFFGNDRATSSWRREFIKMLNDVESIDARFLIVLPEPEDCNWASVDYEGLKDMEHVYTQLHWEDYFINLSARTGILVLHAYFRWSGNAGPTARFEGGKLFALMKEDKVNACVLNYPLECETAQYIDAHLVDALPLYRRDAFKITRCIPEDLSDFFSAITEMAHTM